MALQNKFLNNKSEFNGIFKRLRSHPSPRPNVFPFNDPPSLSNFLPLFVGLPKQWPLYPSTPPLLSNSPQSVLSYSSIALRCGCSPCWAVNAFCPCRRQTSNSAWLQKAPEISLGWCSFSHAVLSRCICLIYDQTFKGDLLSQNQALSISSIHIASSLTIFFSPLSC